jgi:ribosome-interacting GTPase 1
MPTNLPPEYFEVDRRYRAATSPAEKAELLEELLSTIPKHKGTDKLRADLRKKLSKLKSAAQTKKGLTKRQSAFHIDPEGSGQVVLVGPPNVGKSALLAALTNAAPEVSDAAFTTWTPAPGMMPMENIQIQLVDTPSLNREFVEPEMMNLIRRADLILLVVDLQTDPVQQLEDSLALLEEYHIVPLRRQGQYGEERRVIFKPLLVVANKNDDEDSDENLEIFRQLLEDDWPVLPVSAATGRHFDRLKRSVFERLDIIRIYSKPPGAEPNFDSPFVMQRGGTVEDFAKKVHQDFYENLKSARVWGSATHDGLMVSRDHVLEDGDVVELRI